MLDARYESQAVQESQASRNIRNWSQRNTVHRSYPKSLDGATSGYAGTFVHRSYPERVRHLSYPAILVNVEMVTAT